MLKSTEYRSGVGTQSYVHIRALQREMNTALAKQTLTIWGVIFQHANTPAIASLIPRLCDDSLYDNYGYLPSLSFYFFFSCRNETSRHKAHHTEDANLWSIHFRNDNSFIINFLPFTFGNNISVSCSPNPFRAAIILFTEADQFSPTTCGLCKRERAPHVAAKLEDGITPTAMERSQWGKRWIITAFESTSRHMPEIILISCHNCGGKLGFGELFRQRISQKGGNGRGREPLHFLKSLLFK